MVFHGSENTASANKTTSADTDEDDVYSKDVPCHGDHLYMVVF